MTGGHKSRAKEFFALQIIVWNLRTFGGSSGIVVGHSIRSTLLIPSIHAVMSQNSKVQ